MLKEIDHEQATLLVGLGTPIMYKSGHYRHRHEWAHWPDWRDLTPSQHHDWCGDDNAYPPPIFAVEAE